MRERRRIAPTLKLGGGSRALVELAVGAVGFALLAAVVVGPWALIVYLVGGGSL